MLHATGLQNPAGDALLQRLEIGVVHGRGDRAAPGRGAHQGIVTDDIDADLVGAKQPLATVDDLLEHGCRVGHRTADDLQHFGGCGLLIQRFLGLVEQPHVLDRDHRLAGEGLQQGDFLVGIEPGLGTIDGDGADDLLVAQHRHGQAAAETRQLDDALHARCVVGVGLGQQIGDVDRAALLDRARCDRRAALQPMRPHGAQGGRALGVDAVQAGQVQPLAVEARHDAVARRGERGGTLGNDVEHRLHVGRRFADDLQHV